MFAGRRISHGRGARAGLASFGALVLLASSAVRAAPGPKGPGSRPVYVQRFAHYTDWHTKCPQGGACDSWNFASTIPFRHDNRPGVGYASLDPAIIRDHNRELWTYGVVPLISWWGPDADQGGDNFLDAYLAQWDPRYPVRPGLLYEVLGRLKVVDGIVDFDDPENANRFLSDLRHIQERYWSRHPDRFFRLRGRPVLFIWLSQIFRGGFDQVMAQARREISFSVIGSEFSLPLFPRPGMEQVVRTEDAMSCYGIYSPPLAREHGGHVDAAYVSQFVQAAHFWSAWLDQNAPDTQLILPLQFAFDDHLVPGRDNPQLTSTPEEAQRLAAAAFDLIQESATGSGRIAPFILFVSYNEPFEGTALEPNNRYGSDFIDILHDAFIAPILNAPDN